MWFILLLVTMYGSFVICYGDMSSFDCPMRAMALQYAQYIQPHLSMPQLEEIADALNGSPEAQNCNLSAQNIFKNVPATKSPLSWSDIDIDDQDIKIKIFVCNKHGSNANSGLNINSPLKTIRFGLDKVRKFRRNNSNNQSAMIILREGIYHLIDTLEFTHVDSNLIISNYNNEEAIISGAIPLYNCSWKVYKNTEDNYNIYSLNLKDSLTLKLNNYSIFDGLRVNSTRSIRARYPNAIPELDGFGSDLLAVEWFPSIIPALPDEEIYLTDFPIRNTSATNEFVFYQLGIGGICNNFDPPAGYWCGTKTQGGGAVTYQVPHGFVYNKTILPHTPYKNTTNGVVAVWRPAHWANWFFKFGDYNSELMHINFSIGGFQGARGSIKGQEFYIENIFEELDMNNEWFYNDTEYTLYYYNNLTNKQQPTCNDNLFEITHLKVLMNFYGNQSMPIKNITVRGITFRDAAYTEFEPHAMPSGGDCTIQRMGAITIEGAEYFNITNNIFTRNDGIGIILNRYNRNVTIHQNEFVWNGDTAIALFGDTEGFQFDNSNTTMGFDGTTGIQPRFTNVVSNYIHELGIWEKQSSPYFQAKSCQNTIENNIAFNGPRAGINFNDGFGGASNVKSNLLFNLCRESGDHGPVNSWDRQVYTTTVNNGSISTIKAYDNINGNFIIGNYNTQDVIDNDDGSAYYKIFNNFLVYSPNGQKSDSGGHDSHSFNNIYAYIFIQIGWSWWGPTCFHDFTTQLYGHENYYYNNTCVLNNGTMQNGNSPAITIGYAKWEGCDDGGIVMNDTSAWTVMYNNTIYVKDQNIGLCNMTEIQFQKQTGLDPGTKVYTTLPDDQELLNQAKQLLWEP